jgi:hypothetical protein
LKKTIDGFDARTLESVSFEAKNRGPNENKGDKFPFAARGEGTGALLKITKTY